MSTNDLLLAHLFKGNPPTIKYGEIPGQLTAHCCRRGAYANSIQFIIENNLDLAKGIYSFIASKEYDTNLKLSTDSFVETSKGLQLILSPKEVEDARCYYSIIAKNEILIDFNTSTYCIPDENIYDKIIDSYLLSCLEHTCYINPLIDYNTYRTVVEEFRSKSESKELWEFDYKSVVSTLFNDQFISLVALPYTVKNLKEVDKFLLSYSKSKIRNSSSKDIYKDLVFEKLFKFYKEVEPGIINYFSKLLNTNIVKGEILYKASNIVYYNGLESVTKAHKENIERSFKLHYNFQSYISSSDFSGLLANKDSDIDNLRYLTELCTTLFLLSFKNRISCNVVPKSKDEIKQNFENLLDISGSRNNASAKSPLISYPLDPISGLRFVVKVNLLYKSFNKVKNEVIDIPEKEEKKLDENMSLEELLSNIGTT